MKDIFTSQDIIEFVNEHIQSKIDHNELELAGIHTMEDLKLYENALFEGIINGIFMAGGSVQGIETNFIKRAVSCSNGGNDIETNFISNMNPLYLLRRYFKNRKEEKEFREWHNPIVMNSEND